MNYTLVYKDLWKQLLPPILRTPRMLSWGVVLLEPIQTLHNFIFGEYADGATYPIYNNATAYVVGDKIVYTNRGVYQCILNTTGNLPTNATYWKLVNQNYIGMRELAKYSAQKIVFEFGLNRWFVCSGIYIVNNSRLGSTFLMSTEGNNSSKLVNNGSNAETFLTNTYQAPAQNDFTIYVPLAVFNGLSAVPTQREPIIRDFANRLNLAGMVYNVVTY